jgi:hypothetical protein
MFLVPEYLVWGKNLSLWENKTLRYVQETSIKKNKEALEAWLKQ